MFATLLCDRYLSVTVNEVYLLHELLARHTEEVAPRADDPVRAVLAGLAEDYRREGGDSGNGPQRRPKQLILKRRFGALFGGRT